MINTFGHQTIEKTNESVATRIAVGPIKSTLLDENGKPKEKPPFAGDGYYFWEDNIEAADWWGKVRYVNKGKSYRVFRLDLILRYDDHSFFDLVGSRQHLKLLGALIKKAKIATNCAGWVLHNYLTYFRILNGRNKGIFPYKMIRFNDSSLNPKMQGPISLTSQQHQTLMNPFYIICVFELQDISLKTFTFIK